MLTLSSGPSSLFKRRHFDSSILILCVRWYITYKLSYRDLRDMMAERGIDLAHTTILRWVQPQGNTVDFLLSEHRDIAAAKRFFTQAIEKHTAPEKITLDGYTATHTAVEELKESAALPINVCVRTSKYLNNLIEQDHRRVKQRVYPMLGFKKFENAAVTISGIELVHKIKKGQFDTSSLALSKERAPQIWEAVMAA